MAPDYPIFRDPQAYLRLRDTGGLSGLLKRRSEWRALDRCLNKIAGIDTVCDVPCGPGRLFPYWSARGLRVIGVELSEAFVAHARAELARLALAGEIVHGDAFHLAACAPARHAQLIASVRFLYYFERARRIELLRGLASTGARYALVQYKTRETWRGRRNLARVRPDQGPYAKEYVDESGIRTELAEAGLECLRVEPISQFSDRAYVLARRPAKGKSD
jgi:predicted TPR repeat methyltransferase